MLTRREVFRLLGGVAALVQLPSCGASGDRVFTADELAALDAFADVILPEDDLPGGSKLGTVDYIERLITAFQAKPVPAIFAGGPLSDRNPFPDGTYPDNDFAKFVELDRITTAAWQMHVVALRDQLKSGLHAALASAPKSISDMSGDERQALFDAQDDAFKQLLVELVSEAAFAAPEYGGNKNLGGWALASFEGDSLPLGYSQWDGTRHVERPDAPLSTANPGLDPAPLTDDVRQLLSTVIALLGGRSR